MTPNNQKWRESEFLLTFHSAASPTPLQHHLTSTSSRGYSLTNIAICWRWFSKVAVVTFSTPFKWSRDQRHQRPPVPAPLGYLRLPRSLQRHFLRQPVAVTPYLVLAQISSTIPIVTSTRDMYHHLHTCSPGPRVWGTFARTTQNSAQPQAQCRWMVAVAVAVSPQWFQWTKMSLRQRHATKGTTVWIWRHHQALRERKRNMFAWNVTTSKRTAKFVNYVDSTTWSAKEKVVCDYI